MKRRLTGWPAGLDESKMKSIKPKELLNSGNGPILVLDIRNKNKFDEWHIPGSQNIDVYNDIWAGNFEDVRKKLSKLPKDREIVTVCNAGVTSQNASMLLESMGYSTFVLEKGMMGWNSLHHSVDVLNEDDLMLKQIIRVGKGCLSYLVASNSAKECYIVDPSQFVEEYIKIAKENSLKIAGVIETHVHADHLSGAKAMAAMTKAEYHVSGKDFNAKFDFADIDKLDELQIGENKIGILKTPGHTDGSACFIVNDKAILTGDTLFLDGVGRPDLRKDKKEIEIGAKELFKSLIQIKNLDKSLIVLPAHFTNYGKFPISKSLGNLLKDNPSLNINSENEFSHYILNNLPMAPPNYEQIKNVNTNFLQLPRQMAEQLEFGPNRCASR